jgi:hypothetical protein
MATSFVEFKNYGFWAHDAFLEGLLYLIVKELKALPDETEWKHKLIESWTFSFSIGFVGCIPVGLDEKLTDDDKIKRMGNILKLIFQRLVKMKTI